MVDFIGDRRVPLAFVFALIAGLYGLHEWVGVNFVTVAAAEQNIKTLSVQVEKNGELLKDHIEQYEVQAIQTAITDVRDKQWDLVVMVERDGKSSLSRQRENELTNRLADLEKIERCMIAGNKHCK